MCHAAALIKSKTGPGLPHDSIPAQHGRQPSMAFISVKTSDGDKLLAALLHVAPTVDCVSCKAEDTVDDPHRLQMSECLNIVSCCRCA